MRTLVSVSPIAVACALAAVAASSLGALADCTEVNGGAFDRTAHTPPGSGVLDTSTGFSPGDTITFVVSGLTGSSFELINGELNTALLIEPLSSTSATVSYTVTGSNADTTLNTYMLVQAIPYEITIAATCVAGSGGGAALDDVVRSFLTARMDGILMSEPAATSLRNRSQGDISQVQFVPGSAGLAFAQSFAGIGLPPSKLMAYGAGEGSPDLFIGEPRSRFDFWIDGRYAALASDGPSNGEIGVLSLGGDYRVSENMILGMMGQVDWARSEATDLSSSAEGTGWMIGPYLSARFNQGVVLDLRAAWGQSSNHASTGDVTGDFGTSRWLVKGTLSGNWTHGAWRLSPSGELAYMSENASDFVDSDDVLVSGQNVALGRFQFGPEIAYRLNAASGTFIEPFAAVKGVWDFHTADGSGDRLRGRLMGGLNVVTTGGLHLRGMASWDGIGATGKSGYTVQGSIRLPLQ